MELTWPWTQMVICALWPTKLVYHVVKIALNISAVLMCTVRCSSSKGSSSSFGDVCVAITTATRKDESQSRKTKSKPLAEARVGSDIVKPGMGF